MQTSHRTSRTYEMALHGVHSPVTSSSMQLEGRLPRYGNRNPMSSLIGRILSHLYIFDIRTTSTFEGLWPAFSHMPERTTVNFPRLLKTVIVSQGFEI